MSMIWETPTIIARIWTLGAFSVERREADGTWKPVSPVEWGTNANARRILQYLVAHQRNARRGDIIGDLWPESASIYLDEYLNKAASLLRGLFPEEERGSILTCMHSRTLYTLANQSVIWADVDACEAALQQAEQIGSTSVEGCRLLEIAWTCLERGPFLEQEKGIWCHARRGELETASYRCAIWLAEAYEAQEKLRQAEQMIERLLQRDPTDQTALIRLMHLLHKQGLTTQALRRYKETLALFDQQGLPLSPEIEQVVQEIQEHPRMLLPQPGERKKEEAGIMALPIQPQENRVVDTFHQEIRQDGSPTTADVEETAGLVSSDITIYQGAEKQIFAHPFQEQHLNVSIEPHIFDQLVEVGELLAQALNPVSVSPEECASYFGEKQTHVLSWLDQWSGQADLCVELQMPLHVMLAQIDEVAARMNQDQSRYSRRQMLTMLATLPLALLPLRKANTPMYAAETFLPRCAASLIACKQLMKGQEFFYVERVLARMKPSLLSLTRQPSVYQQAAAHLVAQCDILAGTLAAHRLRWSEREYACEHAVQMSQFARDQNLQIIAYVQWASNFFYLDEPAIAIPRYEEAEHLLEASSLLAQSNFYVKRAASFAQRGKETEARECLNQGRLRFPAAPEQDAVSLFADFGTSNLYMWEGLALLELARKGKAAPIEAWDTFSRVGRLDQNAITSERSRVEILNHQAEAALVLNDMELFEQCMVAGVQGAKQLKSPRRLQEAVDCYKLARQQWPQEHRVHALAEQFLA